MNIYDRTLEVAAQTSIRTDWCQIFAQSLQKVESRLGIKLDVLPREEDKCLWIIILPSETYSRESSDNLNIVGFDYHEKLEEIYLITVVGFRNRWYNERLYDKLLKNPNSILKIEDNYTNCCFERQIRFNNFRKTFYAMIKSYDTLSDYLDTVGNKAYRGWLDKNVCKTDLQALGVTKGDAIEKLSRPGVHEEYNWLECLYIVSKTPINCKLFLDEDPATIAEFERQIEQYLRGMILIDEIYK